MKKILKFLKDILNKKNKEIEIIQSELVNPEYDIHASKIDPNDPRLSLKKHTGRILKKGPVIAISATLIGLLMIALTISLSPKPKKAAAKEALQETAQKVYTIPENIRNAPDNTAPIFTASSMENLKNGSQKVPKLGPSLYGNLGTAVVTPDYNKNRTVNTAGIVPSDIDTDFTRLNPDAIKRNQEKEMALTSNLYFSGEVPASSNAPPKGKYPQNPNDLSLGADSSGISDLVKSMPGMFGQQATDQNKQEHKNDFLNSAGKEDKSYLSASLQKPRSPYEVKAGSIIPVSLITGINSDLPGQVIGQVRENVYDTVSGNYLLIPQGSRLLASYDSMVSYAQDRVLVCWNRLILPNGSSLDMECAPGVDLAGSAGFSDQVNHHWLRIISGVLVSSVLSAAATTSQGSSVGGDKGVGFDQLFAANAGGQINDVGQQITKKNIDIQPTIRIRPGFSVNVLVTKDMILSPYQTR